MSCANGMVDGLPALVEGAFCHAVVNFGHADGGPDCAAGDLPGPGSSGPPGPDHAGGVPDPDLAIGGSLGSDLARAPLLSSNSTQVAG